MWKLFLNSGYNQLHKSRCATAMLFCLVSIDVKMAVGQLFLVALEELPIFNKMPMTASHLEILFY